MIGSLLLLSILGGPCVLAPDGQVLCQRRFVVRLIANRDELAAKILEAEQKTINLLEEERRILRIKLEARDKLFAAELERTQAEAKKAQTRSFWIAFGVGFGAGAAAVALLLYFLPSKK